MTKDEVAKELKAGGWQEIGLSSRTYRAFERPGWTAEVNDQEVIYYRGDRLSPSCGMRRPTIRRTLNRWREMGRIIAESDPTDHV